jgi:hypothetical protein
MARAAQGDGIEAGGHCRRDRRVGAAINDRLKRAAA